MHDSGGALISATQAQRIPTTIARWLRSLDSTGLSWPMGITGVMRASASMDSRPRMVAVPRE